MKGKRAKWSVGLLAALSSVAMLASAHGPEAMAAATPRVTIQFWYGLGGQLGNDVQQLINQFNRSQDQVFVQGVVQGNYTDTSEKLQSAFAADNVPAVALLGSINPQWAKDGLFANLQTLAASDRTFAAKDFIPAFVQGGSYMGKWYGLPLYGTTQVLYYRKDMFAKAGISPNVLDTWQGLAEAASRLTKRDGATTSVYGWEPMWGPDNLIDAVYSAGGQVISNNGKKVLIDSPVWVDVWGQFRRWLHVDNTMRIHSGGSGWTYWYQTLGDVMDGKAAGYTGSSGDQESLNFKIIGAHTQPGWGDHPARPEAGALYAVIPSQASSVQQQAAFKFLSFFTDTANTAKWSMETGYIPVRESALSYPPFKAYLAKNPQAKVPIVQAETAAPYFNDPTGTLIYTALQNAADQVEIENVPARVALRNAAVIAQKALDQYNQGQH